MEKLKELKNLVDPLERSRFRSFKIQNSSSLTEMYDAFISDYKALSEKFENAYEKTGLLKGIKGINVKNPKKISTDSTDEKVVQAVEQWNQDVERRNTLIAAASVAGFDLRTLKEGASSSGVDQRLKVLRNRLELLKKSAQAYKQWSNSSGKSAARDYLSSHPEFSALFPDWDNINYDDFGNLLTLELNKVVDELNISEDRKKLKLDWEVAIDEQNKNEAIDALDTQIKHVQDHIEERMGRYNLYLAMLGATGSHSNASLFAYGAPTEKLSKGDYIKRSFDEAMRAAGFSETYDSLVRLSEKDLKNKPPKVVAEFKKANKNVKEWERSVRNSYTELLKKDKGISQQKAAINAAYDREIETIANTKGIDSTTKSKLEEQAKSRRDLDIKNAELSAMRFFDLIDRFDETTAYAVLKEFSDILKTAKANNAINAGEYQSYMDKINKGRDNLRDSKIWGIGPKWSSFIRGGLPGLMARIKDENENQGDIPPSESSKKWYKFFFGENGSGGYKKVEDGLERFNSALLKTAGAVGNVASFFEDFFSSFGSQGAADVASDAGTFVSSVSSGVQAFDSLGPWGRAIGGVLGAASGLAKIHDNKLNRAIERSRIRLKGLQSDYKKLNIEIGRSFNVETDKRGESYDNMLKQREELEEQIRLERDKKKSDKDAILEMEDQLVEINDSIKYYWSDLLKQLYNIDFKDYAKRLGNALMEAFKNGEDAALAWRKTVGDIVREIANEMLVAKFITPMFEKLFNEAFGEDGNGGVLGSKKGDLTTEDIEWLGNKMLDIGNRVGLGNMEAIYKALDQAFPESSSSESAGSLTRIGQNITEETGSTIASYINAIRSDSSVNRRTLNNIAQKAIPALNNLNIIAQSQLNQLSHIAESTRISANNTTEILKVLNLVTLGDKEFYVK